LLLAIQLLPHALPVVHTLQHTRPPPLPPPPAGTVGTFTMTGVQVGRGRTVGTGVQVLGIGVNVGGFVGSSVGFAVRVGASVKVGTSIFGATMTDVGVVVCVEVDSGVFVRVGSGVSVCVDSGVSVACSGSVGIATSVARERALAV
jgi:hypothetical protein